MDQLPSIRIQLDLGELLMAIPRALLTSLLTQRDRMLLVTTHQCQPLKILSGSNPAQDLLITSNCRQVDQTVVHARMSHLFHRHTQARDLSSRSRINPTPRLTMRTTCSNAPCTVPQGTRHQSIIRQTPRGRANHTLRRWVHSSSLPKTLMRPTTLIVRTTSIHFQ